MNEPEEKSKMMRLPNGQKIYVPTVPYLSINFKSQEQLQAEEAYERMLFKNYGKVKNTKTADGF